jgi:hypothetical protein
MTTTTLRLALAALGAVLLGTAATAFAQGETVEVDTTLIMRQSTPTFHGKVKADDENCVEDRKVKLFRKDSTDGGGKTLLGTDHAADSGRWKVLFDKVDSGVYFAVAPGVEQGTAGTIYACKRAKSIEIPIQ